MASDILGLDHVQIAAPPGCEAAARHFFSGLLGLEEIVKPEPLRRRGGVWFRLGAQQLHVGVEEGFAPSGKAHPALAVAADGIGRLADRLNADGVPVIWDRALPDRRRFYCADPWGNRIELTARAT
jgi:catechol 2,3-dioxygenase-like lactoylglutathione lyase family enzyme